MATFYSAPRANGGISLRFDDEPVTLSTYKKFVRACLKNLTFGEIDASKIKELIAQAGIGLRDSPSCCRVTDVKPAQNVLRRPGLDIFQAQSIHRHVLCQYNISSTSRLKSICGDLSRAYASGVGVLQLSQYHRLSPFNIFKCVCAIESSVLAHITTGRLHAEDVLLERDAREYRIAERSDSNSVAVQMKVARAAALRESNFIKFLRDDLGISLRTQDELFKAAMERGERPITPDALFDSEVIINGTPAKWVDFKAYFGTDIDFLRRSTIAQARKYNEAFGSGVIVYEYGHLPNLPFRAVSARSLVDVIDEGLNEGILV